MSTQALLQAVSNRLLAVCPLPVERVDFTEFQNLLPSGTTFSVPDLGSADPAEVLWVRPSLAEISTEGLFLGRDAPVLERYLLTVQAFAPQGRGTAQLLGTLTDALREGLHRAVAGAVVFEDAAVDVVGKDESGWFQANVRVPLYRQTTIERIP